jgi:hypothetical protein
MVELHAFPVKEILDRFPSEPQSAIGNAAEQDNNPARALHALYHFPILPVREIIPP